MKHEHTDPVTGGYRNRAHIGAFHKGRQARRDGEKKSSCPYDGLATARVGGGRSVPTFERSFFTAWINGWEYEDEEQKAG